PGQRQRIPYVVGDVLDGGKLVVVRQHSGATQPGQPANLSGPLLVTVNPGIAGGCIGDAGNQVVRERVHAIQNRHGELLSRPGGFRLIIENMTHGSTAHEVLAVVFQVRQVTETPRTKKPQLNVLLWQRARDPQRGAWSLPGGRLRNDEDM